MDIEPWPEASGSASSALWSNSSSNSSSFSNPSSNSSSHAVSALAPLIAVRDMQQAQAHLPLDFQMMSATQLEALRRQVRPSDAMHLVDADDPGDATALQSLESSLHGFSGSTSEAMPLTGGVPIHGPGGKLLTPHGYRLHPFGAAGQAVYAYTVPGVDRHDRYHEAQHGVKCSVHALNNLMAALGDGDHARWLIGSAALDAYIKNVVRPDEVQREITQYAVEHLVGFNNGKADGRPRLQRALAAFAQDKLELFDPQDPTNELREKLHADLERVTALGLTFKFDDADNADGVAHTVVMRRKHANEYELIDSRSPQVESFPAASMLAAVERQYRSALRAVCGPQPVRVVLPRTAAGKRGAGDEGGISP